MNTDKLLEKYQKELAETEKNLQSIAHTLNQLEIEKGKVSKYEYDTTWKKEENQAIDYQNRLQAQKDSLEHTIKAYKMVKIYQESIEKISKIEIHSTEEKKEIETDIKRLEELLNQNLELLPKELKETFSKKVLKNEDKVEVDAIKEEKIVQIEDYQNDTLVIQNELKHLDEEIEKLEKSKNTISNAEYIKELNSLKKHIRRERGKLLRNRQIINCYEIILNDKERLSEIENTIARDEQDSKEMEKDRIFLQNEIDRNKRFIPKNLLKSMESIKVQSDSIITNEEIIDKVADNIVEATKENEKNKSTENIVELDAPKLTKKIQENSPIPKNEEEEEYFDEEDKDDDFDSKIDDKKSRTIIDGPTKLLDEKPLEELLRLKDKYQSDIQFYREKSNLNDPTLKSYVENLEQKLDEVQKIINKKKLDNMQDKLRGAINNAYDNMKTSQTVNTSSTTSEDNSKDENISETPDKPKKEEPKNNVENSIPEKELPEVIESPLDNVDSKKGENKDTDLNAKKPKEEKKSKKKFKIKNVRKSIKNIAKKTVVKISALAVTLVLIVAGAHSCSMDKKDTKQRNEVVDQIDNENGITTYKSVTSTENNYDVSPVEQETTEEKTESYSDIEPATQSQVNTELESKKDIQTLDVGMNVEPITEKSSETEEAISQYTNQYDVVNTDTETNNLDDGIIYLNNTSEIAPSEYNDNTSIHIGSEVTVDGNIHDDEYDAYYNENSQTSYYGTEPKRVVIGTGIVNDDGMNVIYAYNPDANQKIDELLNEGGEMVSILTANKEKYLQNYDGSTTLTPEEIKSSAEGWYNINDVSINNGKGMSR